jgi:hypothetical protein
MVSEEVRPTKEGIDTPKKRTTLPVFSDTKARLADRGTMVTTWDVLLNGMVDRIEALEEENKDLKAKIRRLEGSE